MVKEYTISCADCGEKLEEVADGEPREPCPKCGSRLRTVDFEIKEEVEVHDDIEIRGKKLGMSGRAFDVFDGDDLSKTRQRWMKKLRIINRVRNYYREKVWDPETGEVLRDVEEKLSEHTGHGSAKNRPRKK